MKLMACVVWFWFSIKEEVIVANLEDCSVLPFEWRFLFIMLHILKNLTFTFFILIFPPLFFSATICLEYLKIGMVYFLNFISANLYNLDTVMTLMQLEWINFVIIYPFVRKKNLVVSRIFLIFMMLRWWNLKIIYHLCRLDCGCSFVHLVPMLWSEQHGKL